MAKKHSITIDFDFSFDLNRPNPRMTSMQAILVIADTAGYEIRLAIVGSRNFNDYDLFLQMMKQWIESNGVPDLIISGGAPGTDSLAERYARENRIPFLVFKADWSQGKKAGPMRNTEIINAATHVLALPSEQGKGTQDSIRKAQQKRLHLTVHWV